LRSADISLPLVRSAKYRRLGLTSRIPLRFIHNFQLLQVHAKQKHKRAKTKSNAADAQPMASHDNKAISS